MMKIMLRSVVLGISIMLCSSYSISEQILFSEKVLFMKSSDPRHVSFLFENGEELSGVHLDVKYSTLMKLEDSKEKEYFNLVYAIESGLKLKHINRSIDLRLVGHISNHPINIILEDCLEDASGSSMFVDLCLKDNIKLINIEILRSVELLKKGGKDIAHIQKAWKELSKYQHEFIKKQYLELPGTKWGYKTTKDMIAVDRNHLNILNSWVESLYSYQLQSE